MKIVAFVPIKLNNERFPGKNTKMLGGVPLITRIFNTLNKVHGLCEAHCFCSQNEVQNYLPSDVIFTLRPQKLDLPTASITDVCKRFAETVDADYYLCAHATAPFILNTSIQNGIDNILSGEYDSALSVTENREFIWVNAFDNNTHIPNYDLTNIPRTQDIKPFYMETSGFWIYSKECILSNNRRIGYKPYFVCVSRIEAIDINYPEDFKIAEMHLKLYGGA